MKDTQPHLSALVLFPKLLLTRHRFLLQLGAVENDSEYLRSNTQHSLVFTTQLRRWWGWLTTCMPFQCDESCGVDRLEVLKQCVPAFRRIRS